MSSMSSTPLDEKPALHWSTSRGQTTISIKVNGLEQEQFSLPGWDPNGSQGPPLMSWLLAFYDLSMQERREKHQDRFEQYVLARRNAEQN
ncbi:hypothetical protein HBH98_244040 [Parastagonospora nodorum]|nr:hypothetical protein HBH53_230520 [Parastagonospora nodorum]KAH3956368.1 hypothetical protein HBH51_243860 [Parastagonospora nodorum]KAH4215542.1 hypothetical protein HBI06_247910 [Parastagonospora nodorum]KAH4224215.1 hypothetical protein HBI05_242060 [Parastagonospora nodorum]KAH4334265.1 hypothetical protein HBH98_244040 [Parastagonospora nodorum]